MRPCPRSGARRVVWCDVGSFVGVLSLLPSLSSSESSCCFRRRLLIVFNVVVVVVVVAVVVDVVFVVVVGVVFVVSVSLSSLSASLVSWRLVVVVLVDA